MTVGVWFGTFRHLVGGYDGRTMYQGGGIVREDKVWASIALGRGPSEGLAMGSIVPFLTTRDGSHPENIVGIPDRGVMPGVSSDGEPGPALLSSQLDSYVGAEKVAVWRVTRAAKIMRGAWWPIGETPPAEPDAFVVSLRDPVDPPLVATNPESYRAWVARPDGTFLSQVIRADGTTSPVITTYHPGLVGPTTAPTTGTAASGGHITAGTYWWCYTWVTAAGETLPSACAGPTAVAEGKKMPLAGIAVGPERLGARVYRGGIGPLDQKMLRPRFDEMTLVGELLDNSTTTLLDDFGTGSEPVAPSAPVAVPTRAPVTLIDGPDEATRAADYAAYGAGYYTRNPDGTWVFWLYMNLSDADWQWAKINGRQNYRP